MVIQFQITCGSRCGSWCGCDVSSVVAVVCPVMEICCVDIVEECGTSLDTELLCGKCAVWPVWYSGLVMENNVVTWSVC